MKKHPKALQHFFIRQSPAFLSIRESLLRLHENRSVNYRCERILSSDPRQRRIGLLARSKLVAVPIIYICADVIFVLQKVLNCVSGPRPPPIQNATNLQLSRDAVLGSTIFREALEYELDQLDLIRWARTQNDTITLKRLPLSGLQNAFRSDRKSVV